jgi:glycosyltransferase involved in cell wall biosynthesis
MSQDPLHLLCIEPRFPGRLGPVADWLVQQRGYRCQFYFNSADPAERWPESVGKGLEIVQFNVGGVARDPSVRWTRQLERGLCYAYGCWEVLDARRPRPVDLLLGRSAGLGSTLFAPVYLPGVPIVNLFDYFYHSRANDLADESGPDTPVEYFQWRQSANAMDLLDLENGVTPWTPTAWQRDLYPREYRDDFKLIFDGIDAQMFRPQTARRHGDSARQIAGRTIAPSTRVVSFVARHLDRTRGFDRFMELANHLVQIHSDLVCVVVGGSPVQRGLDVQFYNRDFREHVLRQSPPHDADRIWFLGSVPQRVVAELLAASDLHVYPSRPYVVSKSLVEAMSSGCVVLGLDTPALREFIAPGETGHLVVGDELAAWEHRAVDLLKVPADQRRVGESAAAVVQERFAQDATLPILAALFDQLVEQRRSQGSRIA